MGRGVFIQTFYNKLQDLKIDVSMELLNKVYNRAWNKSNLRAHFIAAMPNKFNDWKRPSVTDKHQQNSIKESSNQSDTKEAGSNREFIEQVPDTEQQNDLPDLATLFDLTDLPSCNWGDSIHGPAAYLADILEFLRHRHLVRKYPQDSDSSCCGKPNENSKSALDLLLDYRPDLAEIDLTDKNAAVEMPFIDLINERLEAIVVGEYEAFDLGIKSEWHPSDSKVPSNVTDTLQKALYPIGIQLVSELKANKVPSEINACCGEDQWVLRDKAGTAILWWLYIGKKGSKHWRARLMPQTTLNASELNAEPQYIELGAYKEISEKTQSGSYHLPWSLGETQIKELLALVNVRPTDVIAKYSLPSGQKSEEEKISAALAELQIPLALGKRIFLDKSGDKLKNDKLLDLPAGKSQYFLVDLFQKADLTFDEIKQLEQSHAAKIFGFSIQRSQDSCSADSTAIKVNWKDNAGRSQMAKFLRLYKLLGWSISDLDLAFSAPNIGNSQFNAGFALQLALITSASQRLDLPISNTLRVLTRLRTTILDDETESEWAAVFLNTRSNGSDAYRDADTLNIIRQLIENSNYESRSTIGQLLPEEDKNNKDQPQNKIRDRLKNLVASSLHIAVDELNVLVEARFGAQSTLEHADCEGLSKLYGAALLMRAMQINPKTLNALVSLTIGNPFENPQDMLDLCDLKAELDAVNINPVELMNQLDFGSTVSKPEFCLPAAVMERVLALHTALQPLSNSTQAKLLKLPLVVSDKTPREWLYYLDETGAYVNQPNTNNKPRWAQSFGLLKEFVRKLLPKIILDLPQLRLDQKIVINIKENRDCAESKSLLVDKLQGMETYLNALDPYFSSDEFNFTHPKAAEWIESVFVPVLQWAGLGKAEIRKRLTPWVNLTEPTDIKLPADYVEATQYASYLLCCPLETFALISDRKQAIATQLASALSATPEQAWALLKATLAEDSKTLADWWLHHIADQTKGPWLGPISLALEERNKDPSLKRAFNGMSVISTTWYLMKDLGIDAATIEWLYSTPENSHTPRYVSLKVLSPNDFLIDSEINKKEFTQKWRQLYAWASVFRATPDIASKDAQSATISIKNQVLDIVLSKSAEGKNVENSWASLISALEKLLGLNPASASSFLSEAQPGVLLNPHCFNWLQQLNRLLASSGLSPDAYKSLVNDLISANEVALQKQSASLRTQLRKRFSESHWRNAIKNSQDRIREQRRDALVDHLLATQPEGFNSKEDLYEKLLLDTQMSANMTTSRIVQAHAAVQQFAQRCTMGLDREWKIPAEELVDWQQWKWMRTYRVWEACRKIFLYPENWMEPELRDDKSPFFEQLESDLNQGELTNDYAELAFTRYLHKLHEVARLDIITTYYEFNPDEPTMHIVGRTRSQPYKYFYRQWLDERRWTPWEHIDLDIDSDLMVLFKRAGRIHLGWLTATQEENKPTLPSKVTATQGGPSSTSYSVDGATEPNVRWKLQLTTSQRIKEGWQSKRSVPEVLPWPESYATMSLLDIRFSPKQLQLAFQDYGVPEILVYRVDPDGNDAKTKDSKKNSPASGALAKKELIGSFSLASCLGIAVPNLLRDEGLSRHSIYPVVSNTDNLGTRYKELEDKNTGFLLLEGASGASVANSDGSIFAKTQGGEDLTPGGFSLTIPAQTSMLDFALAIARAVLMPTATLLPTTMGLGLPIFYSDNAIDIAVRINFQGDNNKLISSRDIARTLGSLRAAIESEIVQSKIWEVGQSESKLVGNIIEGLNKNFPGISFDAIIKLLEAVADSYPVISGASAPFELAARNHHPLACDLANLAESRGVASVFSARIQLKERDEVYRGRNKTSLHQETALKKFPKFALSFDEEQDAYAGYNWEIFFHAPFLIAMKFAGEGKFEDALTWFHYIFDPIGVDEGDLVDDKPARTRFWKTQPFRKESKGNPKLQRIDFLLNPDHWNASQSASALQDLVDSIMAWRRKPNLPFQVARGRWVAFQKAVVYRYIDTLIAWADARFRVDTREEITAASQLYVLAYRLLGRRPRTDISMCEAKAQNYHQLKTLIDKRDDDLSQYLDALYSDVDGNFDCFDNEEPDSPHINFYNEYFCIPANEKLFELWDKVADRLYKIRNSQNIDGVFRSLSLFAPPIDPALLARAGAAGLSFDQIMAGLNQPRSHYRFTYVLQKANEVAAELRTLGSELLQALEKRDTEELSLLRSRLELQAIRLNRDIRDQQINEAKAQIDVIDAQIETTKIRQKWYSDRVSKSISSKEKESISGIQRSLLLRTLAVPFRSAAAHASALPSISVGVNGAFGSPHFSTAFSGAPIAAALNSFADMIGVVADSEQTAAGIVATLASYERRLDDWKLQQDISGREIIQLEKQKIAAQIRLDIATTEKQNLQRSIESAETTDEFLKSKFTNAKLYDWMVRQVSAVYYKTYQIAMDYARAAEDCLNRELPLSQAGVKVVRADHWNGLRKGLLAATGLIHDLKRLDAEYTERNKRVPELTKHISLAVIDPWQLLELRSKGSCTFKVPEALFDMDHPGHYARRIKSVSLSIPCITGPFGAVPAKLSLMGSDIRTKPILDDKALERSQFPAEAIFTSSSNNDSGLWEPNLRDERYLPFEGAGAVNSEWKLELPSTIRQFDYASISDVVLQIRYTAEAGMNATDIEKNLSKKINEMGKDDSSLWAYTSLRSDLADQFSALIRSESEDFKLRLPKKLAYWLGTELKPTGKVKVAIYGTKKSENTPKVTLHDKRLVEATKDNTRWITELDVGAEALMSDTGFKFFIDGMEKIEDVILFIKGTV